jgi:regulator of protease activity HflC (stomatin/prohibitin superfamily)
MGLEKIIDFIIQFIADFLPFFVTREWERTVLLRFGRAIKVCDPGFHFKIPFADEPCPVNVITTTMETPVQSIITSDAQDVSITAVVKYSIPDPMAWMTLIYDSADAISDITQGHIVSEVNGKAYNDCRDTLSMSNNISIKVRRDVKKYGVYIEQITINNFIKTYNLRHFNDAGD